MMQLSLKATAIATGLLWAAAILCVGAINLADPRYGGELHSTDQFRVSVVPRVQNHWKCLHWNCQRPD